MSFLTAEYARVRSQPAKFAQQVAFFTPGRIQTLRALLGEFDDNGLVDTADPRVNFDWNERAMRSLAYVPQGPLSPWHVDENYGSDGEANAAQLAVVNGDFERAVDFATRWVVTGEDAAARTVVRILQAWARVGAWDTNPASVLNWNERWPLLIQAALMVRRHPAYTAPLHASLQDATRRGLAINCALSHDNNWAAWGVTYLIAAGLFLQDRALFDRGISRWRTVFDLAVVNNIPIFEIYRQGAGQGNGSYGLLYSNFFLTGMTAAAEWARYGGEWLYEYAGPDGSTFKGLWENVRHWSRFPAEYPYNTSGTPSTTVRIASHDDILHALWPHEESQWLLDNFPAGSIRDNVGLRQAVLCYRYRPLIG